MKFSTALPLLALTAQQVTAIALPSLGGDSWASVDLEARHYNRRGNGQGGHRHFGFGGQGGGNGNNNNKGGVSGALAVGASGEGGKGASNSTSTSAAVPSSSAVPPPAGASANSVNAQTSLTLDTSQVQPGLAQNGQAVQEAGQVPSLTSVNNFINFCATQQTSLTNGLQTKTGSCNPTIMGRVVATTNLPSAKFSFPQNGGTIKASETFTISMNIAHMDTGNFVNANTNFFAAPCQVNAAGDVIGHSHVVVEALPSLTDTTPTNPNVFAFFKGLNAAAVNGALTAEVTGGLAPGAYRLASINTCANHQPVLGSIAQHGSFDDMIYFTAN